LGKEDPTKHIIEYNSKEEVKPDKDLEELRKLMSKDKNWYKLAQTKKDKKSWYNIETATNTKDPIILRKILEKGNDDVVSHYAAQNPNCPPEALVKILEKGKNDSVSQYAAENPNCPDLARVNWMRATGKIGKEDPTKHIIEKEEIKPQEPDKDLEELKKLMGSKERENKMKVKLSKSQWEMMGKKTGWIKKASKSQEDIDKNTIFIGKIKSTEEAKKLCQEKHKKLPKIGYEIVIEEGVTESHETKNEEGKVVSFGKHKYRTYLQNKANIFRVRTWIDVSPYSAPEKTEKTQKTENKPGNKTREPYHSLDMHDGAGEDDGY
jgi:hypothetical protein